MNLAADYAANQVACAAKGGVERAIHPPEILATIELLPQQQLVGGHPATGAQALIACRVPHVLKARDEPGVELFHIVDGRLVAQAPVTGKGIVEETLGKRIELYQRDSWGLGLRTLGARESLETRQPLT